LLVPYWVYDKEKKKFIIPEDAPKEIHETYKKEMNLLKSMRNIKIK